MVGNREIAGELVEVVGSVPTELVADGEMLTAKDNFHIAAPCAPKDSIVRLSVRAFNTPEKPEC
jgi:hypothetical protein